MTGFADASALVKRYIAEPGAVELEAFTALFVSALTRVEVTSAIARARRDGVLSDEEGSTLLGLVASDFGDGAEADGSLAAVAVRDDVLMLAADLVGRHPLRAGDAVQLASAIFAREADPGCEAFVCFDRRLRSAAAREAFRLVPA